MAYQGRSEVSSLLFSLLVVASVLTAALSGCGSAEAKVEVGYKPPMLPIRISINSKGEVSVCISGQIQTPIGTFDAGLSGSRRFPDKRTLTVRYDGKDTVYKLAARQEFTVLFDQDEFRSVAFHKSANGDIFIELCSVAYSGDSSVVEDSSGCPGAPPQRVGIGEEVWVCTAYDRLIVRGQPRRSGREITRLEPGTRATVLAGPVCASGYSWWKVRTHSGTVGWVAEGGDDVDPYFLCPAR